MKLAKKFLLVSVIILLIILFSVFIFEKVISTDGLNEGEIKSFSYSIAKDECLKTAGYTWDSFIRACIRHWEFNNEKRMAARLAVNQAKTSEELTVIDVKEEKCPGCFKVQLEREHEKINVILNNWNVIFMERDTDLELSKEKCITLNGRIINKSEDGACKKTELNAGYVSEFGKNCFCCIAK